MQLEAIKQTKVNMDVYLGIYPAATDGGQAYERQRDLVIDAIKTYGTDHIVGVTVGNEFILNYVNSNGGTSSADANGAIGNSGASVLLPNITDMRSQLQSLSLSKTLQVGNAEAGAYFNNEILQAVDYGVCCISWGKV
jgi:exo-beta-1,3-glucanase (GH17 family)